MPRILQNKADYRSKEFGKWLCTQYAKDGTKVNQEVIATWLVMSQQAVSYKVNHGSWTLRELLIIFERLGDRGEVMEWLTR